MLRQSQAAPLSGVSSTSNGIGGVNNAADAAESKNANEIAEITDRKNCVTRFVLDNAGDSARIKYVPVTLPRLKFLEACA